MIKLILIALISGPSWAQENDVPTEPTVERTVLPFDQALSQAKTLYFQGDAPGATSAFEMLRLRVAAGERPPKVQHAETLVYLGEIYYLEGRSDLAEQLFKEILAIDREYPISPYEHPMEVVGMFEMLRRDTARPAAPTPPPIPKLKRLPAWGYAPFGLPQFRQGKKAQGTIFAAAQAILAVTSVASYAHLQQINGQNGAVTWSEDVTKRRVTNERYLVQWPATIGFYACWGASIIQGGDQWRAEQKATPTAQILDVRSVQIQLSSRF